jgi:NO-binding membrane sensor protein with MHYT domain
MGIGIWSMHFVGMLGFSLPVPMSYYWPTVLLFFYSRGPCRYSGSL